MCYGRNCKLAYRLLSNLIRSVVESRKEVSEYDRQKVELARHEGIPVSPAVPPVLGWTKPRVHVQHKHRLLYRLSEYSLH